MQDQNTAITANHCDTNGNAKQVDSFPNQRTAVCRRKVCSYLQHIHDCTVRQMILLQNYYEQRDFNILIWVDSFKKLSIHSTTRFTQDKFFSLFHKIFAVPNRLTKLEFCIAMLSFMLPLKRRQLPSLSPVIF